MLLHMLLLRSERSRGDVSIDIASIESATSRQSNETIKDKFLSVQLDVGESECGETIRDYFELFDN